MQPGTEREAEVDFRIGGSFLVRMHGPNRDYDHTGEYKLIDPPSKLVFTWISDATDHPPTLVTLDFLERGNDTELVLTHERFPKTEVVPDHVRGWTEIVARLAEHVQTSESRVA